MRKFIVTLMASLLSCSAAFAFWPEATDSSLEIGVGYRQDRLEWKTSNHADSGYSNSYSNYNNDYCAEFFGAENNISSKLKWRNLNIWQIEAIGRYVTCDNIYLRANGDYGWITSGKNTDTDRVNFGGGNSGYSGYSGYSNSGNGFDFARSKSHTKGHVYDAKIAVGYQFKWCDDSLAVTPLIGYSWNGQHIQDNHLRQKFYFDDEVLVLGDGVSARSYSSYSDYYYFDSYGSGSGSSYSSSYGGRHGSYHTRWNGPFIGFDFDYRFGCGCCCESDWEIFGAYEFHWARYHAKAHWNLRLDICDGAFQHHAKNAYGHVFDIGVKWDFCECWTLAVKGEFQWWWANHGHDRAKVAQLNCGDIKRDCHVTTPLRDIKWQSAGVSVDLGMVF